MAETILKVKIFIGTPGGLEDERTAAKRIVDEINQNNSEYWGCEIDLVGWEQTLPGYKRAQSLINQDLDKCEYFVGVIWDNWGSKPDDGDSKYSSGFEEEFERAKKRVDLGLMKDIALYFKDINEVKLKDLHPTYKSVTQFREGCEERRKPLFKEFKEPIEFENLFRAKITEIGWQESQSRRNPSNESFDAGRPAKLEEQESDLSDNVSGLIGASSADFVKGLLQRPSDWDATSPYEVARLRLIAASTSRSGNSDLYLGSHDANLLFEKRYEFDFSDQEVRALIDTGIARVHYQNVPLWHWLRRTSLNDDMLYPVRVLAAIGNSNEKINAIRILQCTKQVRKSVIISVAPISSGDGCIPIERPR